MTTSALCPWSQVVRLHPDVEAGDTAVATYAIDLGALVEGDPNIPPTYRRAHDFFAATHLTVGLRRLLEEVLDGLAGGSRDRVLQLRSPFGGGKSHTLAALYHAVQDRSALGMIPESAGFPEPGPVRVAVFDGEKFDVRGRVVAGQRVQTMWGLLAARLGCYDLVSYHDQKRVAPGGDVVAEMLGSSPTLLLLDEILKYVERVLAEKVEDSTLGRQAQDFLQTLSVEVARASHSVLVYSLQSSTHEAYGHEALLRMIDHLTSRVDAKREPVVGDEILPVVKRRLLAEMPDPSVARAVADAYATDITRARSAHALDEATRREAEEERLVLRDRFAAAYPFHPALIDVMRERWASLPDFQRTRGALRFLSVCLHCLKGEGRAGLLLGPGDIPIDNEDVAQAFFTEVGQRESFKAVLQRDFVGPNARVKRIDEGLAREHPALSKARPAFRLATTILAYSFGGLPRTDSEGGEPLTSGVAESELLAAVVGPDLDNITAQAVLSELRQQCLYLHYDGVHYTFRTTPNVTQVLEEEARRVTREEVEQEIENELSLRRLAGRPDVIIWPRKSETIPDREPRFLLAFLPLDFALQGDKAQEQCALGFLTQHGERPRLYRNGLGLAVPSRDQVEPLRHAIRYLKAVERVRSRRQQLNLTTAQLQQLGERERSEKAAFEAAMRSLYQDIWLPVASKQGLVLEKVSLAGRPLVAQTMQERLLEFLTQVPPPRVFDSLLPSKIVELMRWGEGDALGARVSQVVESFYTILDFPRLKSEAVVRRAIVQGIQEGVFGYVAHAEQVKLEQLTRTGAYRVAAEMVHIGASIREDEVDPANGLLVLPRAIGKKSEETSEPVSEGHEPLERQPEHPQGGEPLPHIIGEGKPATQVETTVRLSMKMTRQQLYASFNAIGNLADAAGVIRVSVEASKPGGFDPNWLKNAVLEPLDEADVNVEKGR